jgi:hypothetical protein
MAIARTTTATTAKTVASPRVSTSVIAKTRIQPDPDVRPIAKRPNLPTSG